MKLQSLKLENFQGIKNAIYEFSGHNASIFGDNGTGKTTIFNAFTWLLTGKASTGAKGYSPKTKNQDGEDEHNLTHSVEAVIINDKGTHIILRRAMSENYVKKKGSTTAVFEGHTIDYHIDGVPVKEREFKSTLENIIGTEEMLKILSMPNYFAEELAWEKRRQILLEMCGDVDYEEVLDTDPKFAELRELLKKPGDSEDRYTVDEFKKVASSRSSEIKKEIDTVPARIDEASKALPDLEEVRTKEFLQEEIQSLEQMITGKQQAFNYAQTDDGAAAEKQKKISEAETALAKARVKYVEDSSKKNESKYQKIQELNSQLSDLDSDIRSQETEISNLSGEIEHKTKRRQALYEDYEATSKLKWTGSDTCPTCNQKLPESDVQKAIEEFNIQKAEQLESINETGQTCSKEIIEDLSNKLDATKETLNRLLSDKAAVEEQIQEIKGNIATPMPFEHTKEYMEFSKTIESLKAKEISVSDYVNKVAQGLDEQISRLKRQLDDLRSELSQYDIYEKQSNRISELEKKEKQLAQEYEKIQQGLYLCEDFIRWKIHQVTERINMRFSTVKFQLFDNQINGGLRECCEVLVPSGTGALVPYSLSANNAARINAGLEIISTLSEFWNKSLPIFVDNAESVTQLIPISNQVIRLVVSEADSKLRLEIDETENRKEA